MNINEDIINKHNENKPTAKSKKKQRKKMDFGTLKTQPFKKKRKQAKQVSTCIC